MIAVIIISSSCCCYVYTCCLFTYSESGHREAAGEAHRRVSGGPRTK